jgi:hypothetical protein
MNFLTVEQAVVVARSSGAIRDKNQSADFADCADLNPRSISSVDPASLIMETSSQKRSDVVALFRYTWGYINGEEGPTLRGDTAPGG